MIARIKFLGRPPGCGYGKLAHIHNFGFNCLDVSGTKKAEIVVKTVDNIDTFFFKRQDYCVSDVTNCILSLGGLFKKRIFRISPDIALSIPIHYRGCSSAIACHIRRISDESAHDMQELETASSLRVVVTTDEAVSL